MSQETNETLLNTVPGSATPAHIQHVEGQFEPSVKNRADEFELFEPALFAMPRIFDNGNYIVDEPGHFVGTDDKTMSLVNSPTASATSGHSGSGSFDPPSPMQYDSVKNDDGGEDDHNLEKFSHEEMVPTLANDCLDYQQFVNSSIDRLTTSMLSGDTRPLEIRVFGIPESGTKSRVETQIKLGLELVDARGERVGEWSHIKLPTHMVAREKLKRINGKAQTDDNPVSGTALHESQVLQLDAKVVCASDLTREVIMCVNCVHRERKRLQRKRDNKRAKLANKKNAKNTSITFEPLPDLDDEAIMTSERNKILQFNCCDYVDYSSGETVLPTRFTCYCRHHAEKLGFRIQLALRDHNDNIVATGISPTIMITDDHKSSKLTANTTTNAASAGPRKRNREEYDSNDSNRTSGSSRKANKKKNQSTDGESDSGTSSPVASIPATPTSMQLSSIHGPLSPLTLHPSPDSFPASSAAYTDINHHDIKIQTHNLQDKSQAHSNDFLEVERFLSQLPSPVDVPVSSSIAIHDSHDDFGLMNALNNLASPTSLPNILPQPKVSTQPLEQQQHEQSDTLHHTQQVSTRPSDQVPQRRPHAHISRIIPAEGPVYGGVEVTILGSGFYEGLTCLFGERPAMPTHCWSQNTLVCILPPATNPGTVVVSLKEHPIVLDGQDVPLFTYFDESDRALMELALQVVGLKSTGKLEDARQIAMRIVQGGTGHSASTSENQDQGKQHTSYRQNATQASAVYEKARSLYLNNMESKVIEALQMAGKDDMSHIDTVNESGHTMLHIASVRGYAELCTALVEQGSDINKQDRNGFTPLHFASWTGHQDCVKALLDIGSADQSIQTVHGKLPVDLAYDKEFTEIVDMLGGPLTAVDCDDSYAASSEDEYDSDDDSSDLDHAYSASYPDSSLMFQIDENHSADESEDDVSDLSPIRSNILLRNKSRSNRRYSALQMADWLQHAADPALGFASVTGDRDDTQLSELTQASLFWIRELLTEIQQRASHAIADSKVRARLTDLQQQATEALGDYTIVSRISHLQKYAHTMLHDSKLRARLLDLQQQASSALNDTKLREKLTEVQQLAAHVLAESSALSQDDRALAAAIQRRLDRMATHLVRVREKLPQSARDFVRSTLQTLDDHLLMDGPFTDTDPEMDDDGWPWDNKDATDAGPSEQAPAPLHQLTTQEQEHRHRFLNPSDQPEVKTPEAFSNTVRVHRFASRSKHRLELSSKLLGTPIASADKALDAEQATASDASNSNYSGDEDDEEEDSSNPVYYHGAVIMDENKYLWHREKFKRLKKDKLLYLFWLPILFVVVSLLLLHYVRTNSVIYEYITGFTPSLRKIALMGKI